jgi:hypothetical protein
VKFRKKAKPGDRIVNGGQMGTIVTCPTCDGDGILHDPDEKPEPSTPEESQPCSRQPKCVKDAQRLCVSWTTCRMSEECYYDYQVRVANRPEQPSK